MQYLNLVLVNGASLVCQTLVDPDFSKNNHGSTE